MNNERIHLESKIQQIVFADNGNTVHYNYRINIDKKDGVALEVFTFNVRNETVMNMVNVHGSSTIDCLTQVVDFLHKKEHNIYRSFSIVWRLVGKPQSVISYFYAENENDAKQRFFYGKNEEEYMLLNVYENPIS